MKKKSAKSGGGGPPPPQKKMIKYFGPFLGIFSQFHNYPHSKYKTKAFTPPRNSEITFYPPPPKNTRIGLGPPQNIEYGEYHP